MMKNIAIVSLIAWSLASCENNREQCDPWYSCNEFKPDSSTIYIDVTINSQNPWVPIAIYRGDVDDGVVLLLDTLYETRSPGYRFPVKEDYSAKAIYVEGSGNIIAYDGGRLNFERIENCDVNCYEERALTLDLVLLD